MTSDEAAMAKLRLMYAGAEQQLALTELALQESRWRLARLKMSLEDIGARLVHNSATVAEMLANDLTRH